MTVGAEVFLDTNILLYAAMGRDNAPDRFQVSRRIVLEEDYSTSGQVLAEFYHNAVRNGTRPLTPNQAREWVRTIARKPCQVMDARLVAEGADLAERYDISYWDGAIIAAAERLGAKTLYTDDFEHQQTYGSVTAINPFIEFNA